MRLEDSYQSVILNFDFDRATKTYIGYLEGLPVAASVQATTYENLVVAFHEAVDMHMSDRFMMSRLCVRSERAAKPRPTAAAEALQEDDPYTRRQFLR